MDTNKIIELLGGTAETARICDVSMAAVSQWKIKGIPKTQLRFLKLAKPKAFKELKEVK
jgi:phage terminase Nu1 subunit (DNA packaging protein)